MSDAPKNDGGPAFPSMQFATVEYDYSGPDGMSLRDWFAGHALVSLGQWCPSTVKPLNCSTALNLRARVAYAQADAMLRARTRDDGHAHAHTDTEAEAIAAWNTRPAEDALVSALEGQTALIRRAQGMLTEYLTPGCRVTATDMVSKLFELFDGPEQRKAQSATDAALTLAKGAQTDD